MVGLSVLGVFVCVCVRVCVYETFSPEPSACPLHFRLFTPEASCPAVDLAFSFPVTWGLLD